MLQCSLNKKFVCGSAEKKFMKRKTSYKGNVKIGCSRFGYFCTAMVCSFFLNVSNIKVTHKI